MTMAMSVLKSIQFGANLALSDKVNVCLNDWICELLQLFVLRQLIGLEDWRCA